MKKTMKKLSLDRTTVRTLAGALTGALAGAVGGMGPVRDLDSNWYACPSDVGCGGSHAATCGDASRCNPTDCRCR